MFIHNLKYTLKTLFKNKALIFWTFAFPIILSTFFNMAFSNISDSEKFNVIDIAIINNEEFKNNEIYSETFKELSDKNNKDRIFNTKYVSNKKAKELLENDDVVGYLKLENDEPKLVFNSNGINQTIFKYVTEEIISSTSLVENLTKEEIKKEMINGNFNINSDEIITKVNKMIGEDSTNVKDKSSKNLDYMMIEFYTLIAMTALYGGIISMVVINNCLPNMGNIGKRVSIAPLKKSTTLLSGLLASYITQVIGMIILFLYTIFVLKIDYGDNLLLIILLSLISCLAGLSLGLFVGTIFKTSEGSKVGLLLGFSMLGSFFSGMMGVSMKYVIDKNVPIINKLNPAAMITDGFYSLYYYEGLSRYYINIISLIIFSSILLIISIICLRRQKYDSI